MDNEKKNIKQGNETKEKMNAVKKTTNAIKNM